MDLIYSNSDKEDIGVLKDYKYDLAFGSDENNFEVTVSSSNHVCDAGFFVYIENTEYGGMIDSVHVDSAKATVKYKGRTWHGILNSKVLQPDKNQDYLIVNGEANTVINELISRMGLSALFRVSSVSSGVNISNYKMNRYIEGYTGILKMLKEANGKLNVKFKGGFVELSASPLIDYSQDEQFDTDQISFKIQQNFKPINHVICLGKGDLKDRRVIHVYSDLLGNISGTQTLTGINEICTTYENSNTESDDELIKGGVDIIEKSFASNSVDFSFDSNEETFDVNDIIGAKELVTGTVVKAFISKKVVKIDKYSTSISYECSGKTGSVASSGYPSSGSGATIIIDSALSTSSTNPVQNKVVTNALNNKLDKIGATNPITSTANDTVENWVNLGCGTFWFNKTGCLINQPSQYGFLQNFVQGADVHQVFYVQTGGQMYHRGGQMYHRGGNANGWATSWRKMYDDVNLDIYQDLTSGTLSVGNQVQNAVVCSVTLTPGIYVVTGTVQFAANNSGYRTVILSANFSGNAFTATTMATAVGAATRVQKTRVIELTTSVKINLYAYHNAGATLSCNGCIEYVKIK